MLPYPEARRASAATLFLALALLGAGAPGPVRAEDAATAESVRLVRLRAAARLHPDDADLAWAFASALAREGHPEAEARLREFAARWPGHHPEAGVYLGQILYSEGRAGEALEALDRALARDAQQAEGQLYRGLALMSLGRLAEADAALAEAGRLSPALHDHVARLRERVGSARAERLGRAASAREPEPAPAPRAEALRVALSEEVEPPPDVERGEHGDEERSFAAGHTRPRGLLRAFLAAGSEWDSNPGRESGHGPDSADADVNAVWETGLSYQPGLGERTRLGLGYRHRGRRHAETHEQDRQRHEGYASLDWKLNEFVAAKAFGLAGYDERDGSSYRWLLFARPSLVVRPGPRLGTGEIYGAAEYADFLDDPTRDSLVLDGWDWSVGYRHRVVIPGWSRARATLGVEHSWLRTGAHRDADGFAGAYDSRDLEGRLGLEVRLPWSVRGTASGALGRSWYGHRNAIDFGLGGRGRRRDDRWVSWRLGLRRALNRLIEVELSYRGVDTDSNVRFFDYTRHVLGFELGVVWDLGRTWPWQTEDRRP